MNYPFYRQLDTKDCGPTCIRMLAAYYGKRTDITTIRQLCNQYRTGTTLYTLSEGARQLGFHTLGVQLSETRFFSQTTFPCVALWNKNHFIVVWQVIGDKVIVGDPAVGTLTYSKEDFCKSWITHTDNQGNPCGVVLLLQKDDSFSIKDVKSKGEPYTTARILKFLSPHKGMLVQLFFSLLLGSAISLVFPFLAQSIVDIGISNNNVRFIVCVLIGQLLLSFGRCANRYISSWLTLHISSRVSISMIAHFISKMMKMRISFFDTKMIGDLMQRIQDFTRIETFLTSYVISILIALVGVVVYGFVLAKYGWLLLGFYLFCMTLYLAWIISFKEKRRKIDYMRFQQVSENQSMVIHYIQGMQEIKLNNCENQKLDKWKSLQMKIYDINVKGLSLLQLQEAGAILIDNIKSLVLTFVCAYWVIQGDMTIGMMIAVTYVIGQLDGPFYQMSSFIKAMQEAQISMERINEINVDSDEEMDNKGKKTDINPAENIVFDNVCFRYPGPNRRLVLDNLNLIIPCGKVTAIVGESGSGKSTLLKLLMGFYQPVSGQMRLGDVSFEDMDTRVWRKQCSAVLQSGYLFTETVAQNIAIGREDYRMDDVIQAAKQAEIHDFIMSLPLKYETIIGEDGLSLSGGQRQRIFIARAIYRNTPFVFLDEATNALDACNEDVILSNLADFYHNRTVVIVAHRLSTIVHADNIIVLKDGLLVEQGTHTELIEKSGYYSTLISKQMQNHGNGI